MVERGLQTAEQAASLFALCAAAPIYARPVVAFDLVAMAGMTTEVLR